MSKTVYIVIGGSKGIGLEIVKKLIAGNKDDILIATYNESDGNQLSQQFPSVQWIKFDFLDFSGTISNLHLSVEHYLHHNWRIFLNAGTYAPLDNNLITAQQIQQNLTVNMYGVIELTISLLRKKPKDSAAIQFILSSSVFAFLPNGKNIAYSSAKAGLSHFLQCLSIGNERVVSHIVYFGPIATHKALQYRNHFWKGASPEKSASFLVKIAGKKRSSVHYFPVSAYFVYLMYLFIPNRWLIQLFDLLETSDG